MASDPVITDAAKRFRQMARGYGRALRLKDDPPLPGEPYMSMDDAAAIHAQLAAAAVAEERALFAGVRYARVVGSTLEQFRANIPPELYKLGDCILVWVNEGDICLDGKEYRGDHLGDKARG